MLSTTLHLLQTLLINLVSFKISAGLLRYNCYENSGISIILNYNSLSYFVCLFFRDEEVWDQYLSGLQAMVAGMETAATVMVTPIVFIPYLSAVQLKMVIFHGIQKPVHPH